MKRRFQFGWEATIAASLLALATLGTPALRAQSHPDRPPKQSQPAPRSNPASRNNSAPPPRANSNNPNTNRPPVNAPSNQPSPRDYNGNPNRPPASTVGPSRDNFNNRPYNSSPGARLNPRQQVGVGSPRPFVDKMRDMTPPQRERQLQNMRVFQNMPPEQQNRVRQQFNQWDRMTPQQKADLREKEQVWRTLTPEQKQHIKNDVLPQWKQMPWGRQQVLQQKLSLLQNMPESARNQRLNDPNFTRGMNDQEKSMLHDLAHLHVGGAPDPPSGEP